MSITPVEFIEKWQNTSQREEQGAHSWFNDLCELIDHPKPTGRLNGLTFTFEQRVETGKADAYYENHFVWEFKSRGKNLEDAMRQALGYSAYLKTPPLLIVSDFDVIRIRTNFPKMESVQWELHIADLLEQDVRATLKRVFTNPDSFDIGKSRDNVTTETAALFETLRKDMDDAGYQHQDLARYLNQIVFCLYAENAGLLPKDTFTGLVINLRRDSTQFRVGAEDLFKKMNDGGVFGSQTISHFNGELFDHVPNITLNARALERLAEACDKNWSDIEPSIFGTLFERALGLSEEQAPLGAHYTSAEDILRIVKPVVIDDLGKAWEQAKAAASAEPDDAAAIESLRQFRQQLANVKVLDPACGSGNFLYVTLKAMLDIERKAIDAQVARGANPSPPTVSPAQMMGLEINEYATQLAKTSLWIGYIQWHQNNGFDYTNRPILDNIHGIECRDAAMALLGGNAVKAQWPAADYIVGNPPFLGAGNMKRELGETYTDQVRKAYKQEIGQAVDLCCYWFEQARAQIENGNARRAGLIGTQGIRFSSNRKVLQRIKEGGDIFAAYDDLEWKPEDNNSAAVHVSIVCFDDGSELVKTLNESSAKDIDNRLMDSVYLDRAQDLPENSGICFAGVIKGGAFDLTPQQAGEMLNASNPNGRPNDDVIKRYLIGRDLNGKPRERWLIDFKAMQENEAMLYEAPYQHCLTHLKPARQNASEEWAKEQWWIHNRNRVEMRRASASLKRYIGTSQVSKHRFFQFIDAAVTPDATVTVFAREDDYFLGILESRIHKVWTAAVGTQLRDEESGRRYIISDCFEKFPFPKPTQEQNQAIEQAAHTLDTQRRNVCQPDGKFNKEMTELYNDSPAWLQRAHATLDEAVADAYGWPSQMTDAGILQNLVALNLSGNAGTP